LHSPTGSPTREAPKSIREKGTSCLGEIGKLPKTLACWGVRKGLPNTGGMPPRKRKHTPIGGNDPIEVPAMPAAEPDSGSGDAEAAPASETAADAVHAAKKAKPNEKNKVAVANWSPEEKAVSSPSSIANQAHLCSSLPLTCVDLCVWLSDVYAGCSSCLGVRL
jgi:hypothetical protein